MKKGAAAGPVPVVALLAHVSVRACSSLRTLSETHPSLAGYPFATRAPVHLLHQQLAETVNGLEQDSELHSKDSHKHGGIEHMGKRLAAVSHEAVVTETDSC